MRNIESVGIVLYCAFDGRTDRTGLPLAGWLRYIFFKGVRTAKIIANAIYIYILLLLET